MSILRSLSVRTLLTILVCAISSAFFAAGASAQAQSYRFDISATTLSQALREFGQISGQEIIFTEDLVAGVNVSPLRGDLTVEVALDRLLEGTELVAERSPSGAVMIKRRAPETNGALTSRKTLETEGTKFDEIVVTGTHIRGVTPKSSPLTIYDRKDIEQSGAGTVEQFLRTLPQNVASMDPTANAVPQQDPIQAQGNAFNGGGVNLHGLGFNATLVLLNGHRVAPAGSNGSFSDVTLIPVSAVERIEVLSSGASAIYGADAVAGVVNIILRNTFDGAEVSARYGDSTEGGGEEYGGSLAFGQSWNGGNAMASVDYLDQSGLQASERDFVDPSAGVRALIPSGERKSAFVTVRQQVSPRVQLNTDVLYSDRKYVSDSILFGGILVSHIEGDVEQRGFAPGASIDLPGDWRANIAGNYSRLEQSTKGTSAFFGNPSASTADRTTSVTSLDIVADGSLLPLPGGKISAALGVSGKTEKLENFGTFNGLAFVNTDLKRDNFALFGELRVPIIGQDNAKALAERLELSVAGRYDRYSKGGSKTTPSLGLSWSPVTGANIRGTYGQSFRVPGLEQLVGTPSYFVFPIPNPAGTNTIVDATASNTDLQPEQSTAYTLGFDLERSLVPNTSLSATYFRIKFKDRIGQPILQGGLFNLYNELDQVGQFVRFDPSQAEVDAYFDSGFMDDFLGLGRSNVGAIFDSRPKNLAESISEGIDLFGRYDAKTRWGGVGLFMGGTHLFTLRHRLTSTTPPDDRLGTYLNPPDLKLRGGVDWSLGNFGAMLAVGHISDFVNPLVTPHQRVASWTTGDVQLTYRFAKLVASLNVINVTNKSPPYVETPPIFADVGYDPANASPLGRFISLRLTSQW